ncbi:MAG: hypothetical protein AAGF11_45105 [Myxococcota bacterium]
MAAAPTPRFVRHASLCGAGVLLGIIAGMATPSTTGCVYHDTCIKEIGSSPSVGWSSMISTRH